MSTATVQCHDLTCPDYFGTLAFASHDQLQAVITSFEGLRLIQATNPTRPNHLSLPAKHFNRCSGTRSRPQHVITLLPADLAMVQDLQDTVEETLVR